MRTPKREKIEDVIFIDDSDLEGVKFPHDDQLVIILVIGNSSVKRVFIDNGGSMEFIFANYGVFLFAIVDGDISLNHIGEEGKRRKLGPCMTDLGLCWKTLSCRENLSVIF